MFMFKSGGPIDANAKIVILAIFSIILGMGLVNAQPWDGFYAMSEAQAGGNTWNMALQPEDSITVEVFLRKGCQSTLSLEGLFGITQRIGFSSYGISLTRASASNKLAVCESANTCYLFNTWGPADTQWVHVALQVFTLGGNGNRIYFNVYLNGIKAADNSFPDGDLRGDRDVQISLGSKVKSSHTQYAMISYIDNLRVSKGWRYHGPSITPPDSVFDWDSKTIEIWDFNNDIDTIQNGGSTKLYSRNGTNEIYSIFGGYIAYENPIRYKGEGLSIMDTVCPYSQLLGAGGSEFNWTPAEIFDSATSRTPRLIVSDTVVSITLISHDTMLCHTDTTEVQVYVSPMPDFNLPVDTQKCLYNDLQFSLMNGVSYKWSPFISISDSIGPNPITTTQIDQQYYVDIIDSLGCHFIDSVLVDVLFDNFPQLPVSDQFCVGDTIDFLPNNPFFSYSWTPSSPLSPDSIAKPITLYDTTGWFYVTVTDSMGCSKVDSVDLVISANPIIGLAPDTVKCINDYIQLDVDSGGGTVIWSAKHGYYDDPNATNVKYYGSQPDTLSVKVTDVAGCSAQDTMFVTNFPVYFKILNSDTAACVGDSIRLLADTCNSVTWFDGFIWNTQAVQPVYIVSDTTWIIAQAVDTFSCSVSDTINVYPAIPFQLTGYGYTDDSLPLSNSKVVAFIKGSGGTWTSHISTTTDSNGFFSLPLNNDTFRVRIKPDTIQYPTQMITYYDSAITIHSANDIFLSFCPPDTVALYAISGGSMMGSGGIGGFLIQGEGKTLGNGDPISKMRLVLMKDGVIPEAETITELNGAFSFDGLNTGSYSLWADSITADNSNPPTITLGPGEQIDSLIVKWKNDRLIIDTSTGINGSRADRGIWISPNPSNGNAILYLDHSFVGSKVFMRISDPYGRTKILESLVSDRSVSLPRMNQRGLYIVQITQDGESYVVKWLVQ